MDRKAITTKEDLLKVIEIFENTGMTYWLDGGWGVDGNSARHLRRVRNKFCFYFAWHWFGKRICFFVER